MKTLLATVGMAVLLSAGNGRASSDTPQEYPLEKYKRLWENSPFTLPAEEEGPASPVGLGAEFTLLGVSRANGEYIVSVLQSSTGESFTLGSKPNDKGLLVEEVHMRDKLEDIEVVLRRRDEKAALKFNLAAMRSMPAAKPAPPPPGVSAPSAAPQASPTGAASPPPPPKRIIRRQTVVTPPPANQ